MKNKLIMNLAGRPITDGSSSHRSGGMFDNRNEYEMQALGYQDNIRQAYIE